MKSNKKNDKKESATQQLLNLKQFVPLQIGDNGAVAIEGEDGMLYTYIMLRPDNISVLGRSEVLAKIRNLQNILSDVAELQMLCMSSAQNYEALLPTSRRNHRIPHGKAALLARNRLSG